MAQALGQFTITKTSEDAFLLHIEDEDGNALELEASYEQLDVIAESIEEHLDEDMADHDMLDGDEDEDDES